jgi:hypothetical protein
VGVDVSEGNGTLTIPSPAYKAGEGIKESRERKARREGWRKRRDLDADESHRKIIRGAFLALAHVVCG